MGNEILFEVQALGWLILPHFRVTELATGKVFTDDLPEWTVRHTQRFVNERCRFLNPVGQVEPLYVFRWGLLRFIFPLCNRVLLRYLIPRDLFWDCSLPGLPKDGEARFEVTILDTTDEPRFIARDLVIGLAYEELPVWFYTQTITRVNEQTRFLYAPGLKEREGRYVVYNNLVIGRRSVRYKMSEREEEEDRRRRKDEEERNLAGC